MDGYNALSGMPHSTRFISQRRALSLVNLPATPLRDAGGLVEEAFEIYKTARMDGHTPKKAVTTVVNELELNRRRINAWAERYEWETELTDPQLRGRAEL